MTITTETQRVTANGNGSATVFSFSPIVIFESGNLSVVKVGTDDVETTITEGTGSGNYTLNISGEYPSTGSITYPSTGSTRLESGESIVMRRMVDLLQETDLGNQGAYFPEVLELALDKATAADQMLQEQIDRSVMFPVGDSSIGITLPSVEDRANQLLGFDGDGNPIASEPSSALVSSAMQPVVSAATLALARAAMGISQVASVDQFGATGDGTTDDTAAFQAALDASLYVYIPRPATSYRLTATLELRAGHFIVGCGPACILDMQSAVPIFSKVDATIARGEIYISDMRLYGTAAATGIRLTLQQRCIFDRLLFCGLSENIVLDRGRNFTIRDCTSIGNSIRRAGVLTLTSTSDADYLYYVNLINYQVVTGLADVSVVAGVGSPSVFMRRNVQTTVQNYVADRLDAGVDAVGLHFENDCQNCKVIGGSSYGATKGISLTQGTGATVAPSFLEIIGHDISSYSTGGVICEGGSGASPVASITIMGGNIRAAGVSTTPAIVLNYAVNCLIKGVNIVDYAGTNLGIGPQIANCVNVTVEGCHLYGLAKGFDVVTSVTDCQISDNYVVDCTIPIAGTISGAGNIIRNNRGINPITVVTTPAVPSSGASVTNDTGTDVMVCAMGGEDCSIGLGGVSSGVTFSPAAGVDSGLYLTVPANTVIDVAYASAFTWKWIGV